MNRSAELMRAIRGPVLLITLGALLAVGGPVFRGGFHENMARSADRVRADEAAGADGCRAGRGRRDPFPGVRSAP